MTFSTSDRHDPGQFAFSRDAGPSSISMTMPGDASLDEVLEELTYFLRGCGFHVPEGSLLDFVGGENQPTSWGDPQLEDTIESDGTTAEDIDP